MGLSKIFPQEVPTRRILLALFLLALGLRLISVFTAQGIANDGCAYLWLSMVLPKMASPQYPRLILSPLFPILARGLFYVFGDFEISGRMVSLFLGSLTVFPLFFLVEDIFNRKAAALTVFFFIIHPYLLQASAEVLTEATYFFLLTSIAYLAWLAIQRKKALLFIPIGILLLLASLARLEGVLPTFLVMGWLWFSRIRSLKTEWRWKLGATAICLSILIIFASTFMALIHQPSGKFISIRAYIVKALFLSGEELKEPGLAPYLKVARGMSRSIRRNLLKALHRLAKAYYPAFLVLLPFGLIRRKRLPGFRLGEVYILSFIVSRFLIVPAIIGITDRYLYAFIPMALSWAGVGFWEIEGRLSEWALARGTSSARRWSVISISAIMLAVLGASLPKGLNPIRAHRAWQKEVGHWLKENSGLEEFTIASQRPQEAFYAGSHFYQLKPPGGSYEDIMLKTRAARVDFLIVDKKFDIICPDFWNKFDPQDLEIVIHQLAKVSDRATIYRLKYPPGGSSSPGAW